MSSLVLATFALLGATSPPQDSVLQASVPARPRGTLVMDLGTGGVLRIRGTDASEVRLLATLRGRDWRKSRVRLEPTSTGARLVTTLGGSRRGVSTSHQFDVWVPRAFDLQIESAGGDVSIHDVSGSFRGGTRGGTITLERVTGTAELTTRGGNVLIAHATLDGSVTTRGGGVELVDVHGNVVTTPRAYNAPGDVVQIDMPAGPISVADLPSGAVLRTGAGNIEAGPAAASVVAITGLGDVTLHVDKLKEGDSVFVRSGTGRVVVELPSDYAGELDLQTGFTAALKRETRIETDWQLRSTTTAEFIANGGTPQRYVTVRTRVGTGSQRVVVRTTNGDIVIRRGHR